MMKWLLESFSDPSQLPFFVGILIAVILAITLLVIVFISQIRSLKELLAEAKEIDSEKNREIGLLQDLLKEIQLKDDALEQELQSFNETKLLLKSKKELIFKMQEKMNLLEEREKKSIEKFELHMKEFQALSSQYRGLRKRNEILVEESSQFRSENTKILHKVREQERRIYEKLMTLQGNRPQLLREMRQVADAAFEKNHHYFETIRQKPVSLLIEPLGDEISKYQHEVLFGYQKSLRQTRNLHDDAIANAALYQKIAEDILAIKEQLKDEEDLDSLGSKIVEYLAQLAGIEETSEEPKDLAEDAEQPKRKERFDFLLPDEQTLLIDAAYTIDNFELYNKSIRSKKETALGVFLQSLQEYIDMLSQGIGEDQYVWMLLPDEEALLCAIANQSRLYDHAHAKRIILVGPSTLFLVFRNIFLDNEEKRNYDLAQSLASAMENIYDQFMKYGESISRVSHELEILQESFDVQANEGRAR